MSLNQTKNAERSLVSALKNVNIFYLEAKPLPRIKVFTFFGASFQF